MIKPDHIPAFPTIRGPFVMKGFYSTCEEMGLLSILQKAYVLHLLDDAPEAWYTVFRVEGKGV